MTAAKKLLDDKFLRTLVPLGDMDPAGFARLLGKYRIDYYEPGEALFEQGDRDHETYYLLSGQLNLRFISGLEKLVEADTKQARYALAPEQPRKATAVAQTKVSILAIDSDFLDELLHWNNNQGYQVGELEGEEDSDWMTKFLQSKVFLKLPAQNIQALMMRLEEIKARTGQQIIRQGDDDGFYYIVKSGRCKVTRKLNPHDKDIELSILGPGSGFGEEAIITHNRRGATVTMLNNGRLMRLARADFTQLLVEPLLLELSYNEARDKADRVFLDVRSYEDYIRDGIQGSINIALPDIRPNLHTLDAEKHYIACSNTGSRAAAAAFLLGQHGISAYVLRQGLAGLPETLERGNAITTDDDHIPVVDNVVSFAPGTKATTPNKRMTADEAMTDPHVKALFSKAKHRVEQEALRANDAEQARVQAETEVVRLRREAGEARRQMDEAQREAQRAIRESAEEARLEASKEAAKLREIELGCKEAEMEEAIRQAQEEADRARAADKARRKAEQEIHQFKQDMQAELQRAQEEARISTDAIRQFAEKEARKQQAEARRQVEEEAQRAREAEQAHKKAQGEIEQLRTEALAVRARMEEQSRQLATQVRLQAEREAALQREEQEARQQAQLVTRHAQEQAERIREAEGELQRLRSAAEQAHCEAESRAQAAAQRAAEAARAEAMEQVSQISAEQQTAINFAIEQAEQQAQRAQAAEQARLNAEAVIQRLKVEAEQARALIQKQLSADIERSEIEHEVARARAIELANKQAEIEDVARCAAEEYERAQASEQAHLEAKAEVERLRTEMQILRRERQASQNAAENVRRDRDLEHKEAELEVISIRVRDESQRARLADEARVHMENEINRLRTEVEVATLQAQAQLEADKEQALRERVAMQQSAADLECKQREIDEVQQRVATEARRAREAEVSYHSAQREIEQLKTEAEQAYSRGAQHARQEVFAEQRTQRAVEAARADIQSRNQVQLAEAARRAKEVAQRAEIAERARKEAEQEIRRLKLQAEQQRQKAEQAIQDSIKAARREADKRLLKQRAAEKARQSIEMERKKANADKQAAAHRAAKKPAAPKSGWVSDQAMWETTLGMRDDSALEMLISPDGPTENNPRNLEARRQETEAANQPTVDRAVFRSREVNPYVQSQRIDIDAMRRARNPRNKIILAVGVALVLGIGGYYFSLDASAKKGLRTSLNELGSSAPVSSPMDIVDTPASTLESRVSQAVHKAERGPIAKQSVEQSQPQDTNDALAAIKARVKAQRLEAASALGMPAPEVTPKAEGEENVFRGTDIPLSKETPTGESSAAAEAAQASFASPDSVAAAPEKEKPFSVSGEAEYAPSVPVPAASTGGLFDDSALDIQVDVVAPQGKPATESSVSESSTRNTEPMGQVITNTSTEPETTTP